MLDSDSVCRVVALAHIAEQGSMLEGDSMHKAIALALSTAQHRDEGEGIEPCTLHMHHREQCTCIETRVRALSPAPHTCITESNAHALRHLPGQPEHACHTQSV